MKKYAHILFLGLIPHFMFPLSTAANVTLPAIFKDHIVLQQNTGVEIWGWAQPFEVVAVVASWNGQTVCDTADNHANWRVKLRTPAAGGPYSLTITGIDSAEREFADQLIEAVETLTLLRE